MLVRCDIPKEKLSHPHHHPMMMMMMMMMMNRTDLDDHYNCLERVVTFHIQDFAIFSIVSVTVKDIVVKNVYKVVDIISNVKLKLRLRLMLPLLLSLLPMTTTTTKII